MKKPLTEIKKNDLFQELFQIVGQIRDTIKQDMSENGIDENQPVALAVWPDQPEGVLIDGYTRHSVGEELGIDEIPVMIYSVESEQVAFDIALKRQANRRSLTDSEIFPCIEIMKSRYGDPPNGGLTHTVQEMADKLGISKRKTERALRVAEEAPDDTKEQIRAGKTSIHRAEVGVKSSSATPRLSKEKPKDGRGRAKRL